MAIENFLSVSTVNNVTGFTDRVRDVGRGTSRVITKLPPITSHINKSGRICLLITTVRTNEPNYTAISNLIM